MSPDEIVSAYEVLAQQVRDQGALDAAKIGNSQRSLGTLASRAASPTGQTSGLANYTYNRAMRPTIASAAQKLLTQGRGEALSKFLNDNLLAAKAAYEDAKNKNAEAASAAATAANQTNYTGTSDSSLGGADKAEDLLYPAPPAGTILSVAYRDEGLGRGGVPVYDIVVADGNGGTTIEMAQGYSSAEALANYRKRNPGAALGSEWLDGVSSSSGESAALNGGGFSGR